MTLSSKILVFGSGRLSIGISAFFPGAVVIPKESCDITDRDQVIKAIRSVQPDIVLNAAAITKPALCEEQHGLAWRVNVYGARNIAYAAREMNTRSIHISSNWAADPTNEYGRTKFVSEQVGFDLVVRVCFYDESYWVLSRLSQGDSVALADTDQFNPISVAGMLKVLERMIEQRVEGIVNIGVVDRLTHYEFGVMLGRILDLPIDLIKPITLVNTTYAYPYNTYIEPHRLSRLTAQEDIHDFRNTLTWRYSATDSSLEVDEPVSDMRSSNNRGSELRDASTSGRVRE